MQELERRKRLYAERWRHRLRRKGKQYDRNIDHVDDETLEIPASYKSRILDLYGPAFSPFRKRRHEDAGWFVVPSRFSLTKNTHETLSFYRTLVAYARRARVPKILVDHRGVDYMGLAADTVLGVLLKEISRECRGQIGYSMTGWKAKKREVKNMMDQIGCVRVMTDPSLEQRVPREAEKVNVDLKPKSNVFRYRNSGTIEVSPLTMDRSSEAGREFSDHIDQCLGKVNKKLTDGGRASLLQYFGEIVDNAMQHSGLDEWVVCGYIDPEDPDLIYRCTIVSFGETFASTFRKLPAGSEAFRDIATYLALHERGSFFSRGWRVEDLIAVVALQGDISCKNVDSSTTRGQGTVEFIRFFQLVSKSCVGHDVDAVMALLTGRTKIIFDGRYSMERKGPHQRKIIAFNAPNDLSVKPDPTAVFALDQDSFPGVVISIAAPLARTVVEAKREYGNEN